MSTFEIVEYIAQLLCGGVGVEPKYPAHDMIGSNLSVGLRSRGSVAGLKGLTTTRAGSGRRYKLWQFKNRDWDNEAPWGYSRWDRAIYVSADELGCGSRSLHRSHTLELANLRKTEKIR